jgi:uncharacterized Zn-finger protein
MANVHIKRGTEKLKTVRMYTSSIRKNPMIAMPHADTFYITTPKTACDGDKESPHPRVFLTIGKENTVDCPYCGRHFALKEGIAHERAH